MAPKAPAALRLAKLADDTIGDLSVAVIITSHNYGHYLAHAIDSALGQTSPPKEIVVVDDSSTDNTKQIVDMYPAVEYVRVEWKNLKASRMTGMNATKSSLICFLDADDALDGDYLCSGTPLFQDMAVGVVYSDAQEFGSSHDLRSYEPVALSRQNFAHATSLVRRSAIQLSGYEDMHCPRECLEDWMLWRLLERDNWVFLKNPSKLLYRQHPTSYVKTITSQAWKGHSPFRFEPMTLFIPLSGRASFWRQTADWLDRQNFDPDRTSLVLCDTSRDVAFNRRVRKWAATSRYSDVRTYTHNLPVPQGLADQNRRKPEVVRQVRLAVAAIYRRMIREVTTEYVCVVEDDIIPPNNAIERLLSEFEADVMSVSGCYPSPYYNGPIAWKPPYQPLTKNPDQVEQVRGNGFGCVVIRRETLLQFGINNSHPTQDYDLNVYAGAADSDWRVLLHPGVVCEHLGIENR